MVKLNSIHAHRGVGGLTLLIPEKTCTRTSTPSKFLYKGMHTSSYTERHKQQSLPYQKRGLVKLVLKFFP